MPLKKKQILSTVWRVWPPQNKEKIFFEGIFPTLTAHSGSSPLQVWKNGRVVRQLSKLCLIEVDKFAWTPSGGIKDEKHFFQKPPSFLSLLELCGLTYNCRKSGDCAQRDGRFTSKSARWITGIKSNHWSIWQKVCEWLRSVNLFGWKMSWLCWKLFLFYKNWLHIFQMVHI